MTLAVLTNEQPAVRTTIRYVGISLSVISPLLYANDGDPYRAYEIVVFGMLMLIVAVAARDAIVIRRSPANAWILAIVAYIAIQPVFGAGEPAYNLKYAVSMLMCFAPLFALQALGPYGEPGRRWCERVLGVLFGLIALNTILSYLTGAGEVYEGGNLLQRRAFGWLGDSIGPAVVFFAFYFHFAGRRIAFALALLCLLMMQAKMSLIMLLLGHALLFLVRHRRRPGVLLAGVVVTLLLALSARWWLPAIAGAAINNLDYSVNNRLFSFAAGVVYFLQSPIVGVGANRTYSMLLGGFDLSSLAGFSQDAVYYGFLQIQNAFIRTAAELGLVGLALFLGFCVAILRVAFRVLLREMALPRGWLSPLHAAIALWLIAFIAFHQTTGWFEAGSPQLAWLVSLWAVLTCVRDDYALRSLAG